MGELMARVKKESSFKRYMLPGWKKAFYLKREHDTYWLGYHLNEQGVHGESIHRIRISKAAYTALMRDVREMRKALAKVKGKG